jgi:uroporphyrinogen decarboxylase
MMNEDRNKILLEILNRKQAVGSVNRPAFWFMRQAGRYLPEYRELREHVGGFLDLVYNPDQASEITLQPIRRFGMDAAILFSDILVIPQALGQALRFETGEGPKLNALTCDADIQKLDIENIDKILNPIYETIKQTRTKLSTEDFHETSLIGFAGSPWTVACYMVEGGGSKTFEITKKWAYGNPESFQKLIDVLVQSTIHYLIRQIEAGVEAVQLFDSWAGVLDNSNFNRWIIDPTRKIVDGVKAVYPDIPIIGFPRDAGEKSINYAKNTGINAIGLDYSFDPKWAADNIQPLMPVQGNLDPVALLSGGDALERSAHDILETFSNHPFIFNLGHGIIKETPPEHVEKLCEIIRNFKL